MEIIRQNIQIILDIIGLQSFIDNQKYRFIKYVFIKHVSDGVVLYNNLTKGMLYLTFEEYSDVSNNKELINQWYLVPEEFDDKKFSNQVTQLGRMIAKKTKVISSYTIFTTTDCNARCFYCYEKGVKKIMMPNKVARDVGKYIAKKSAADKVDIMWFGGEPLYNIDSIDIVCKVLKQKKVNFTSGMISNSYLFDDEIINKAIKFWNLKWIQITLDGTEKIYNRTKSFIYNDNAYVRVLQNIRKLLQADISVRIRLNITSKNADDLNLLVDDLYKKFSRNKKLRMYVHTLFESTGLKKDERNTKVLFELQKALEDKIYSYGYAREQIINGFLKTNKCMSDNDSAITILPMGQIGKCEHYSEGEYCGSIYSELFDENVLRKFKEPALEYKKCSDCQLYPDCYRLKVCLTDSLCLEDERQLKLSRVYKKLEYMYDTYENNECNIIDENDEIEIQC